MNRAEWNAAGMELSLLTIADGMRSVNYILDIWSSQSQVMCGLLFPASSRFRQGRVSQQSRLLGRKGACKTTAATELFARAVSLFALPSSCCQGVFSSFQKQQLLPQPNSPRSSGDTSSASIAEENPVPMGLLAATFGSSSIFCCLAKGQLKPLSISLGKF